MFKMQLRIDEARYAMRRGVIQQRAYTLISVERSWLVYEYMTPFKHGFVIIDMLKCVALFPNFRLRRIRVCLWLDCAATSCKRATSTWAETGPQIPSKKSINGIVAAVGSSLRQRPRVSFCRTILCLIVVPEPSDCSIAANDITEAWETKCRKSR